MTFLRRRLGKPTNYRRTGEKSSCSPARSRALGLCWVRLHEKGGKKHELPCHHNLKQYLDDYIAAAGIAGDPDGYLFRTAAGKTGALTENPLRQQDAYRMIQRRALAAGIKTHRVSSS